MQAAFRYPGFDVVYEGMKNSSNRRRRPGISRDGRNVESRSVDGFTAVYREHINEEGIRNPVLTARSFRDGTISHMENFFDCIDRA